MRLYSVLDRPTADRTDCGIRGKGFNSEDGKKKGLVEAVIQPLQGWWAILAR